MNDKLIQDVKAFCRGDAFGLRVLVVPDDTVAEHDIIERCIKQAIDSRTPSVIVASDRWRARPYESIKNALINGYTNAKAGSTLSAALSKSSELLTGVADNLAGGVGAVLVKIGIRKLTNTPVTPLSRGPVDRETLREVLEKVCAEHRVLLYIRQTYHDEDQSRLFLSLICTRELERMLGDKRDRLMVLFTIRESDRESDQGANLVAIVDDAEHAEIIELEVDGRAPKAKSIGDRLRGVKAAEYRLLMHVCTYCGAADSSWFESGPIAEAAGASPTDLKTLEQAGFVRPIAGAEGDSIWALEETIDRDQLVEAISERQNKEWDRLVDKNPDCDDESVIGWGAAAARNLLRVLEKRGSKLVGPDVLLELAVQTGDSWRMVDWFGKCCIEATKPGCEFTLEQLLSARASRLDEVDLNFDIDEDADQKAKARYVAGVAAIVKVLEWLEDRPWGPVRQSLAEILDSCLRTCSKNSLVEDEQIDRWRELVHNNRAFLQVLTDEGRLKLVRLANEVIPVAKRNTEGVEIIRDTPQNGSPSELVVVRQHGSAWLFASSGEVLCFPLTKCPRRFIRHGYLPDDCDELSLYFNRDAKWDEDSATVSAACPVPEDAEGAVVLLVCPNGLAFAVPASTLASTPGARTDLDESFLKFDGLPKWAVTIDSGTDLFVATSGNRVLRLAGKDLINRVGVIGPLASLQGDEGIAAVTTVDSNLGLGSFLVTVTTGGYGKAMLASEFSPSAVGARGLTGQKEGARTGTLCTIEAADPSRHLLIATSYGFLHRLRVADLPVRKREHVGLKLIDMSMDGDAVAAACTC